MDAFFCAIEELEHPEYKGKPLVVGADPNEGRGRGVVSTANYAAREYGVHSAMPISQAYKLCPHAIFVPPKMGLYSEFSKRCMAVLDRFSPLVQQISVDEAFLDCSGTEDIFGTPIELATKIRTTMIEETKLTCSVGIASNKSIAKIASELNKPNGFTICPEGQEKQFLAPLPLKRLWGAGKKTIEKLKQLGFHTIGDVAQTDGAELERTLGMWGHKLYRLANGYDSRPVEAVSWRKSISAERTFGEDTHDDEFLENKLFRIADELARSLRAEEIKGRTITLKIRLTGFETFTRSYTLKHYMQDSATIRQVALRLFHDFDRKGKAVRLIGIGISNLDVNANGGAQLELFGPDTDVKKQQTDKVLDNLKEKFGKDITRASFLK